MNVGLINDEHSVLLLIREDVFQIFARRERARRVVGVADVVSARVRVGFDHRFHVVRVVLAQRHFNSLRADPAAGAAAITRTAHHPRSGGRRECRRGIRQRNARAWEGDHVILRNVFRACQERVELQVVALRGIAPPHGRDFIESFQPFFARAHGVFVGRDPDHFGIVGSASAPAATAAACAGGHLLLGLLRHGEFMEERDGRAGPHGNPADLPTGISTFEKGFCKFRCERHSLRSPGVKYSVQIDL